MIKEIMEHLQGIKEISKEPVKYEKTKINNIIEYNFKVDSRNYVVVFNKLKDKEFNLYEVLFYIYDKENPIFNIVNDFNKLVIKNTILKIINDFITNTNIDILGYKTDINEPSKVRKYKTYLVKFMKNFNFYCSDYFESGIYYRYLLIKNKNICDLYREHKNELQNNFNSYL